MNPTNLERRYRASSLRASESAGQRVLSGYAARWNSLSLPLGNFRERLAPRCFDLEADDQRMLYDHDSAHVLGRKSAATLTLLQDDRGLKFRCVLPDTSVARDVHANVAAGNLDGMSFGMLALKDAWANEKLSDAKKRAGRIDRDDDDDDDEDDPDKVVSVRTIVSARCLEVSAVAWPAYEASNVEALSAKLWPGGQPQELRSAIAALGSSRLSEPPTQAELQRRLANMDFTDAIDPAEQRERLLARIKLATLDL